MTARARAGAPLRPPGESVDPVPLLLLPGTLCDHRLFERLLPLLRSGGRPVAVGDITQGNSIAAMATAVLERAEPFVALAGISQGAIVALEIWRRAPERIAGLALLDVNPGPESFERGAARLGQIARARSGALPSIVAEELKPLYLAAVHRGDRELLDLLYRMAVDLGPAVFERQAQALRTRADSWPTLAGIIVPTLVLCGAEDSLCPPELHARIAAAIPGAKLEIVPDAGHLPVLEEPARTAQLVGEWAAQVDAVRLALAPRLHFTPPKHWMNDPNGLLHHGGRWRLYFQYAEDAPAYRHPGWGCAVSDDLLEWSFEGLAIAPAPGSDIYSGCALPAAVVTTDPADGAVYAFHTTNRHSGGEAKRQTQDLAVSHDGGRSFERTSPPLLDEGLADFRDPFVLRLPDGELGMLLVKPVSWEGASSHARSRLCLYRADSLRHWREASEIARAPAPHVVWEVPWLMPIDGAEHERIWVLGMSEVERADDTLVCRTRYSLGELRGSQFIPSNDAAALPLDHGPDYYAAIPACEGGRHVALTVAWLGSWRYARALRLAPWHGGLLSLPRELRVARTAKGLRLRQCPLARLAALRAGTAATGEGALSREWLSVGTIAQPPYEIEISVDVGTSDSIELELAGESLRLELAAGARRYVLSRFADARLRAVFAGRWTAEREIPGAPARVQVFVDTCAVEIFADDGAITFGALVFPRQLTLPRIRASGGSASVRYAVHRLRNARS